MKPPAVGVVRARQGGFTLLEVLVALVIVAFGMAAVLAALSNSAANIAALREKTLAQWVALNQVADTRLNLQAPQTGTTEGDVKNFGNGDWHWQQIVSSVQTIPGLLQVTVKVRRNATSSSGSSGAGGSSSGIKASSSTGTSSSTTNWTTTVIGFRGDALAASSGESVDWNPITAAGSSSSGGASSSSGATTGTVTNPGTVVAPTTPTTPGSSSSSGA